MKSKKRVLKCALVWLVRSNQATIVKSTFICNSDAHACDASMMIVPTEGMYVEVESLVACCASYLVSLSTVESAD